MNQETLDRLLNRTASSLAYPATPDLAPRVMAHLATQTPRRRFLAPRTAAYAIATLLLALSLALAVGPSRDAIARLFGVEGSTIEVVPDLAPRTRDAARTGPFFAHAPGLVVEPADLPSLVGFEAVLPEVPGARLDTRAVRYGEQWVVIHRYETFHVWQTKLLDEAAFGKLVTPQSILEAVSVNGADGVWLSRGSHVVRYLDENGDVIPSSSRIVEASTLIWRTDAFFYRIETDLTLEEALRIAETLP